MHFLFFSRQHLLFFFPLFILFVVRMGQEMPLPERIPVPASKEDRQHLATMGIVLNDEKYSTYTLPTGWSLHDDSTSANFPKYSIVDPDNHIRVSISGYWKGSHENQLYLTIPTCLKKHEPEKEEDEGANLLREYRITIETTVGCGDRGDAYVAKAYDKLVAFKSSHPDFVLPPKHKATEDAYYGTVQKLCTHGS
jgi:hypothetical protein